MNNYINKRLVKFSILIFTVVVSTIVLLQSFVCGYGFNMNWSVSRYMGTSSWSATLFTIGNIFIILFMLKYFLSIKKHFNLSKIWLIINILMIVALFSLSIFPVGLFDETWGQFGAVSTAHRMSAFTLFITMCFGVLDSMIEIKNQSNFFKTYGIAFLIYAIFCIIGYITEPEFYIKHIIFFESAYILADIIFYYLINTKEDKNDEEQTA